MMRLPDHIRSRAMDKAVADLSKATRVLLDWTTSLPSESHFYINQRVTVPRRSSVPKGLKHIDLMLADVFFDLHSFLAGQALLKGWRAGQLAEGLLFALENWNLTIAASVARSLVESAAAVTVDCSAVAEAWAEAKVRPVSSTDHAMRIRRDLFASSKQLGWGTRIADIVEQHPSVQRTNVLTLVAKASKKHEMCDLPQQYERLCDAVHPSWGASECFWQEAGQAPDLPQVRVLLNRESLGYLASVEDNSPKFGSRLPLVIFEASTWSLRRLVADLESFSMLCRDICLTCRIYALANMTYWGVVKPSGPYERCACGSGRKSRFCSHVFGKV